MVYNFKDMIVQKLDKVENKLPDSETNLRGEFKLGFQKQKALFNTQVENIKQDVPKKIDSLSSSVDRKVNVTNMQIKVIISEFNVWFDSVKTSLEDFKIKEICLLRELWC